MDKIKLTYKRKGFDLIIKSIHFIQILSYFIIFMIFIVILLPESSRVYLGTWNFLANFDRSLETGIMQYAYYLMIAQLVISVIGILFNWRRHKRKNDRFHVSLLFYAIFSLSGIIVYKIMIVSSSL